MRYLHTMLRVSDIEASLEFYCQNLGLVEVRRKEVPAGKFTLIFLATALGEPEIELTYNWDQSDRYSEGRNFGHIAYEVEDIYATCQKLMDSGVEILRPPRDGYMAFVRSPDNISIELLQKGGALPEKSPWKEMPNKGQW